MKQKWNRLLASLLCALMLCSDVAGLMPRASAAPDPAAALVTDTGDQDDFRSEQNGRPNLFVDFLGDNNNYIYTQNGANAGLTPRNPTNLNNISVPAPYDQSGYTNPTGPGNDRPGAWFQYKNHPDCDDANLDKTVFWVGLGVDRTQLLELVRDGTGLTSLEAGFYYDSTIIEPYIDYTLLGGGVTAATATEAQKREAYQKTVQKANIANPNYPANTQWSSDYQILRALPGVEPPETDQVTREELETATMNDIMNNTLYTAAGQSQWKMTYISLELKDVENAAAKRRLAGVYTGVDALDKGVDDEGNEAPILPASAQGDQYIVDGDPDSGYDYNYLLLIPFRLKNYGSVDWTPLRLVRDATHLSIGGGTWGVDDYGAWERTTTRNGAVAGSAGDANTLSVEAHPDRDLKLLTRFAGDLNLFSTGRTAEYEYDALLRIIGDGGSLNHAKLTVKGDPAVWPVWADTNGDVIGGLQSGQGMHLDVHTQDNYVATVTVTYVQDDGNGVEELVYHQYTQTASGAHDNAYEFVMPAFVPVGARRVTVTVAFTYRAGDDALVYLTEVPQPGDADYAVGNETTIRTSLDSTYAPTANTETINSYSPTTEHPNYSHPGIDHPKTPVANAKKDQYVEIQVETHADYDAVVQIYDFKAQCFLTGGLTIDAIGISGVTPDLTDIDNPAHLADPTDPAHPAKIKSGRITLPRGGTIRLRMGSQDLDVIVTYEKGARRQATLEVYNTDPAATNFDLNTAQLVYDLYDALNQPSKAYSSVTYHDYDKDVAGTVTTDDHRAIKGTDKLPWISASQGSLSGSLGGDTGRTGKVWDPMALPAAQQELLGGKSVMALLASSAQKSDFRDAINGMDLACAEVIPGLTGLRKNAGKELYGDPDVSAALDVDVDKPTVIDALWELRQAIDADTAAGGLKDTYLKTVYKADTSVAYTYYDLTPAQLQAYLLEIFDAAQVKAENDLAYRIAQRRYLTILNDYNAVKDIPAYAGMAELKAPAVNLSTTVTNGTREYQGSDYKDTYLAQYDTYLDDYEDYLRDLDANAGTGGSGAPTAPTSYPGATVPSKQTISLKTDTDAVAAVGAYKWKSAAVPTAVPTGQQGNTIETRSGRTVYIVLEADSAYELDTANTDIFQRGPGPDYDTGARIATATPVAVPGYQNVYAFTMPDQDCVVQVAYKLRGTRQLNITYKGAAGLDDNEAVVEVYSVAHPAAVTPQLNSITNKGYTTATLPSGGSYDAFTDTYVTDPVKDAFKGSTVTIRAKAAKGYEVKSVEAKNSDDTVITVTKRPADDPADGDVYTFVIPEGREDDVNLVITYGPEVDETFTATIQSTTEGAIDGGNKATWYVQNSGVVTTPTVISNVRPTTHLIGHVTVAPGYYIKSVTAWGASGNYPYTITGNGYNNGFGTSLTGTNVPIEIYVDMPHEDLVVDVVFAKGPPEPAPDNTLTLIVKDDDNTEVDPAKAAANWARAKVFDQRPTGISTIVPEQDLPTVGALPGDQLGKNADHGAGTLTDRKYVETGKWVLVDFSAAVVMKKDTSPGAAADAMVVDTEKSYYVSSVTVGPDHLGVALVWEGSSAVSFYMPAGSTAVTVEFSKYPDNGRLPDYVLTVRETYTDLNPGAPTPPSTDQYSYITSARSATIGLWSTIPEGGNNVPGRALDWNTNPELVPPRDEKNGTGAATAGEKVTMTFDVDIGDGTAANPGWYYQSVVLISNGAGTRLSDNVTEKSRAKRTINGKETWVVTYQVEFYMPASGAEFVVNYRKGPKPTTPDYAFTLIIDDPHNVMDATTKLWDDNSVSASFQDPTGAAGIHSPLDVGRNKASMSAVQHIHADDIVTLKTTIADGYYLEYMIVNPAGLKLIPVWSDANTASFTMPKEGVAVVARVVKGTPQQYTANLILRYDGVLPAGKTIHDVGRGTFVIPDDANPGSTLGSLDDYAKKAIYSTVQLPGTDIPYDLYAFDGYYIDRITVEPAILGVTGSLSGSCGYQDGDVIMPHASINVNVWFKAGWPDEIPYDLTIKVHDSSLDPAKAPNANDNNYAALRTVAGRAPAPVVASGDKEPVFGGQTRLVDGSDYILDRDTVILDIHAMPGFHVDSSNIKITDTQGNSVAWWYVPGGVAFTQPPRSVVADITFKQGEPDKKYTATLHLGPGMVTGDHSADADIINDYVLLSAQAGNTHATTTSQAAGTTAPPAAVNTDAAVITSLYHGDGLDLSVRPGANRHITSAYAVSRATGAVIPIYGYDHTTGDLTAIAVQYVPGKAGVPADNTTTPPTPAVPGAATKGAFAMPESDVDVYVNYADGTISATDMVVKLVVSGPAGAGSATADITEPAPSTGQSMSVNAPGVDTRFTAQGNQTVVTFDPNPGYGIAKLEVTNNSTGAPVPYEWISVLQDPPVVDNTDGSGNGQDNTDLWPGVAPAPGITHPSFKPNPDKQIRLTVPSGGVTIHVTYATESTEPFKAQVVVNDPLAGDPNSRNDAGFPKDVAGTKVLERLKYATPGEWVDLDITVHPGYRIEYVKVVPQSFGIVPGLPIGTDMGSGVTYYLHDQSTGFTMPSGDVTVYVKFVADGVDTKNVTLAVVGTPTGNTANRATITSPASGTKGPVYVQGKPQSVSARPKVDWIDVDYQWDVATSAVASITVQTAADGTNVPFTQVVDPATGQGRLTFPMVSDDVIVTIAYKDDPTPVGQEVMLHVIDKDKDATKAILLDNDNYGRLQYAGNAAIGAGPDDTGKVGLTQALEDAGTFAVTETIHVPAGQSVDVTACSNLTDPNGPVYIESAYVLFEQNGQMIHFNLTPDSLLGSAGPGYSGLHDPTTDPQSFVVHPGRNDVYVTLTRKAPRADEHAAVLMLRSPASDTQSEAGIHADQSVASWNDADPARRDKVRVNDPSDSHAYVTATDGEKITISVEPATGYVIDYVQITPLGFPLDTDPVYHFDRTGNTITFDMPHVNVAVTVYLKRGSDTNFKATLHYIQDPACLGPGKQAPQVEDYAKLSWTPVGEPTESIWADAKPTGNPGGSNQPWGDVSSMIVKEGSTVTLDVTLDTNPTTGKSDVILAAFVVWKDRGSIVTLTPSYPAGLSVLTGLEGVTESASGAPDFDNSLADGTGSFKMPMGDVEVYVVVTTEPPTDPWHTVALVATDHSPTGNNSGLNEGDLWNHKDVTDKRVAKSDTVPTIAWVTVTETETISVLPRAAAGYRFDDPAVMTGNDGITQNLTTPYDNFLYEVTSILCNQVIRIDFESGDDLTLTVEIEDPDNPGDGTVEQVVTADPAGTAPPTLRLTSTSVAGSYQIMKGVTAGGDVKLTAKPYKDDKRQYSAYATLYYIDGTSENVPLTDADNDGVWEGSFPMPANNARVVVTFYDGYEGALTLVNRISGDATGQAAMTEDKRGLSPLSVHSLRPSDSFQSLPNATKLDAYVTSSMTGRTVKGLLTRNGLTTILPATHTGVVGDPDHFYHTIDRADAEITLILDSPAEHPDSYLAAVDWVGLPAGTDHPEIEDKTTAGQLRGSDKTWTTAVKNDTVEVTLNVPYGYKATVHADGSDVTLSAAGPFQGPAVPGAPTVQTVTFPMPARDVQVTVTYTKTIFDLTLRVIDTTAAPAANTTAVTPAAGNVVSGGPSLNANGQSMTVRAGGNVDVSATPATGAVAPAKDPHIVAVYYQTASGTTHWLEPTALAAGDPSSKSFTMPEDDVVVTVIYDDDHAAKPEDDYYIATVVVDDPTNHPGNKAVSIVNIPAAGLPSGSPSWAAGHPGSGMKVSYEVADGYHVTVTAKRADTNADLPVLQLGSTANGTASVTMPAANIVITLTYEKGEPPKEPNDVALQLLGHKAQAANEASTSNFTDPTQLVGLATTGVTPDHAPHVPAYTHNTDPVETVKSAAKLGDDLRTLASSASGSQVVRMTVAVRKVTYDIDGVTVLSVAETPEVDLLVSKYNGSATSRAPAPITHGPDEEIVIRVYYGNIYKAIFHLVGEDATDGHTATDTVPYTSAYDVSDAAISKPIQDHLDRFEGYQGDGAEDIQTTATAGPGRRVVDVVWESDLTGAASATFNGTVPTDGSGRYDFTMPEADVDFYAFFEKEPDDPDDRSYVAKVAFDPASQHLDDPANAVSIQNLTNDKAPGGKYWTEARDQDSVEVTVKVAAGYQAEIVTTKIDDDTKLPGLPDINDAGTLRKPLTTDDYQYYISRTQFIYNLPAGKEATFTMPKDTDATVTVKFTKGYDLTMRLRDRTRFTNADPVNIKAQNTAVSTTGYGSITNTASNPGDGSPVTVTASKSVPTAAAAGMFSGMMNALMGDSVSLFAANPYAPGANDPDTLYDLPGNLKVTTAVTLDALLGTNEDVTARLFRTTPFTGTQLVAVNTKRDSANPASLEMMMGYEDTLGTTELTNGNELYAAVQTEGERDIEGNVAKPIYDYTNWDVDNKKTTQTTLNGTKTDVEKGGNTVDLSITIQKGYVARVKVRRDDQAYLDNPNDPTKWNYLDGFRYHFASDYQYDDAGTLTWGHDDLVSDPGDGVKGERELGVTEVVLRPDDKFRPQSTFPGSVCGVQHFRFTMPQDATQTGTAGTDGYVMADTVDNVTVIVTFEKISTMPQPFDPRNVNKTVRGETYDHQPGFLEEGFIYGENRGDYAIVEIPTLAMDEESVGKHLYDTDNYDEPASGKPEDKKSALDVQRFTFAVRTVSATGAVSYERLEPGTDVELVPWREDELVDPADPYNYYVGEAQGMWSSDDSRYWETNPKDKGTDHDFVGSKFKLYPTGPDPKTGQRTAGAQALYEMLNDQGSLETYTAPDPTDATKTVTKYRTRLVVRAEDAASMSDYTEVWIRPWFALGVKVNSYGPTHPVEGKLYRLMDKHELNVANGYWDEDETVLPTTTLTAPEDPDPDNFRHYKWDEKTEPMLEDSIVLEGVGSGKWLQILRMRSSELLGGFNSSYDPREQVSDPAKADDRTLLDNVPAGQELRYALEIEKTSNLTYTRIKLDLDPHSADYAAPNAPLTDYYEEVNGVPDYTTRTFMLQDTIQLIAGDVDQNGATKVQDYDAVYDFVYRSKKWSDMKTEPEEPAAGPDAAYAAAMEQWAISVYNPESAAYRCDLDGDRRLTVVDLNIVNTRFNYNRTEEDYHWYYQDGSNVWQHILPFGMGPRDETSYDALFALRSIGEGEIFTDPYWDETVDPAELSAVPMETFFIGSDGIFRLDTEIPELPAVPTPGDDERAENYNERVETPVGEDALGQESPAVFPEAETPALSQDPEEPATGDDPPAQAEPGRD